MVLIIVNDYNYKLPKWLLYALYNLIIALLLYYNWAEKKIH